MERRDQLILENLKKGDEASFWQLFDLYYRPLCVFSLKYTDSIDVAEDIVQDVFVSLWEKNRFSSINESLRSYLFTSVKNNSLCYTKKDNCVRFQEVEKQVMNIFEEESDMDLLEQNISLLYEELDKLSIQNRRVFEAIVFENRPYKEVALDLGISVNSVKTYYARALNQLRSSIDTIILILLC